MTGLRFQLEPLVWAEDLAREPEPDRYWRVPGMLEAGDRLIVTGGEGEGKSTLLRQWGIMIAAGIHPLTLERILPQRVLILDLENSREQIKEEILKICNRAGITVPGEPYLAVATWPQGIDLTHPDYESALKVVLERYTPDVIVGGPLYKMADLSLSDEDASKRLSSAIDRLRHDFHFALVLEAHQVQDNQAYDSSQHKWTRSRAARPFGSSLWRRWPEFGLCLFTDGTLFKWRQDRQYREWPQKLIRDGDTWLWQPDNGLCPACTTEPVPEGRKYCSDRCQNTAKIRRSRARKANTPQYTLEDVGV